MQVVKAPGKYDIKNKVVIFLAGSIENGKAEDLRPELTSILKELDKKDKLLILNPWRANWDSSWKQEITNLKFKEQVEWELNAMEASNIILLFFDPETKSPISLLELGLHAKDKKLIVYCPNGFWRKGNVDVTGKKYNFPVFDNKNKFIELAKKEVEKLIKTKT